MTGDTEARPVGTMRSGARLAILTAAGSALCWWPIILTPNLDLPQWSPLIVISLLSAISTVLSGGHWLRSVLTSSAGTLAGPLVGFIIWTPSDPEAAGYIPIIIIILVAVATVVSFFAALIVCKLTALTFSVRRLLWIAFGLSLLAGPTALAMTPTLVALRVAHNDRLAEQRFIALKRAVEVAAAQHGGPGKICDGPFVRQSYDGPPFSERNWRFIQGNYVQQDGYMFGIWCDHQRIYTINATPFRGIADGTRRFCADESGRLGCGNKWIPFRDACTPCEK